MGSLKLRLQQVFREVFDSPNLEVKESTTAQDIEDWDSLTHITLVVAIEKSFGVHFNLGEIQELKDVGDMISLLEKKVQK